MDRENLTKPKTKTKTKTMHIENTLLTILGFSAGFMLSAIIGARRANLERIDGYHLGVREGRRWAREQRTKGGGE